MYDYYLGGTHNFPADREAAAVVEQMHSTVAASARANRAFLQRAVRHVAGEGVRQFLDIGSGLPTQGNVHEVAETIVDDARVVYVDIDPVAVSESLEILDGNQRAIALFGDLREPEVILDNADTRALIDFNQPVALLLVAVLHFLPDDVAYDSVARLVRALAPGSFLVLSHATLPVEAAETDAMREDWRQRSQSTEAVYRQNTTTQLVMRPRPDVARFFEGLDLVEPGLVWTQHWRPAPTDPTDFADNPALSGVLAGVARVP
jgi:O-methyltransferase involved in polyketide biosynthesis